MAFNNVIWDYSNDVEMSEMVFSKDTRFDPTPEVHDLKILHAEHVGQTIGMDGKPTGDYITVYFTCLDQPGCIDPQSGTCLWFKVTYYLTYSFQSNGEWVVKASPSGRNPLIRLGKALAGAPIGIPFPDSIVGGVVRGKVFYETSRSTGNAYPRVSHFAPSSTDIVQQCSDIEQYSVPQIDDSVFGESK